jgi:hypothetical protein
LSATLGRVRRLVSRGEVRVSNHGYDELAADGIFFEDLRAGIEGAIVVEDYPDYAKGPCVLVLQKDPANRPIHVLWGVPREHLTPAVLITAYRPDPTRWSADFLERSK